MIIKIKKGFAWKISGQCAFLHAFNKDFQKIWKQPLKGVTENYTFCLLSRRTYFSQYSTYHGRGSRDISHMKIFLDKWENFPVNFYELITLQTHHLYSTLK